ncbi:hypothetical protein FOZ63_000126, partial [Perkinsus olseni]
NEFLNKINVQTALGVSKEFVSSNREVLDAFDKFTTYDTTRFVVDLLDGGIKVALRDQGGIWRIGEPSIASCYDGAELAACTENELASIMRRLAAAFTLVVVVAGNYDYITNAIGNLNWMTGLKGKDNYGEKLRAVQPKTLKYPKGGVLGTVRASQYATTGAKIAFINVTDGGHYSELNNPRGMQRSFQDFLYGRLW